MVITPSEPWSIHEDSTGEFSPHPRCGARNSVLFWEDVYPTEHNILVPGVRLTVKGLLGWLQNPRGSTYQPRVRSTIGATCPPRSVDVTIAKGAKNEDPDCPSHTCVLWLDYPQWDVTWGIAKPQVQRFYLSDVSYGGRSTCSSRSSTPTTPAT